MTESPDQGTTLQRFDRLPDVLARAGEEVGNGDVYTLQERLRAVYEERVEPYKWSMPLRHFLRCAVCGEEETEIRYELGDGVRRLKLESADVHQVREHGGAFPPDVEAFLLSLSNAAE